MLTSEIIEKLNNQINLECFSSNLYLQMGSWCAGKGLDGCAAFLKAHAAEEMEHMLRLFDYVNECGACALLGTIAAPPADFGDVRSVFVKTLEHEQIVTRSINELVHAALTSQDYSTFNFLQWYVAEQHEEEKLFKGILDKFDLMGVGGSGLYHFDRAMAALAAT